MKMVTVSAVITADLSPLLRYYRKRRYRYRGFTAAFLPSPRYLPQLPRYYRNSRYRVTL